MKTEQFIGRNAEARTLIANTEQGRASLLIAEAGMGKTALLEFLQPLLEQEGILIYAERVGPGFTAFLKQIFEGLWEAGRVEGKSKDLSEDYKTWSKHYKSNDEKAAALVALCETEKVILVIDDASGISPGSRPWLIKFVEVCTVIAGIEPSALKKNGSKRFWKHFDEVRLGPLSKAESLELIELLISKYKVNADDMEIYKRAVLDLAQGSPFEINRLIKYHSSEALVKSREIMSGSEIFVERDVKQLALAPLLFIITAFAIAGRYIARVQGDMDFYVLSAILLGLFIVAAPLLRMTLKPRSK